MWVLPVPLVIVAVASVSIVLPLVASGALRPPSVSSLFAAGLTGLFSFRVGYADVVYFAVALLPLLLVARYVIWRRRQQPAPAAAVSTLRVIARPVPGSRERQAA